MENLIRDGDAPLKKAARVPGLQDLAQWVFGPQGLSKLQLLAYGDFSKDGRYAKRSFLFCRNDAEISRSTFPRRKASNFRLVKEQDWVFWDDVITPIEHLLKACPVDEFLEGYSF